MSERGEGGPLSFPLRPSSNQSPDPCAHPSRIPSIERTLAELLRVTLLLNASESFSRRTFSFDLGRQSFPETEISEGLPPLSRPGALLRSPAALADPTGSGRGEGAARNPEAVRLAGPLQPPLVSRCCCSEPSLTEARGESRARVLAEGLPRGRTE